MYLKVCHLHQSINVEETKRNLCDSGFLSLRDEMTQTYKKGVGFLPFSITPPVNIPEKIEIMVRSDGQGLCHIQLDKDEKNIPFLDLHIIAPDANSGKQIANVCNCFGDVGNAHPGTRHEEELVERVREKAAKSSPNGTILHDKNIAPYLSNIYRPEVRISLRAVAEVFGGDAVPLEAIIDSIRSKITGKALVTVIKKLITEQKLFDSRCVIWCNECGTTFLEFPDLVAAEESLKRTANRKCKICDEGEVKAVEAYAIKDTLRKVLEQGLWLEQLTYNSLKPFCTFVEVGRIVDPFELDVIAVFLGEVLLCECKDTSFGQNDFISLDAAANEVDAEIVGVITTRPLHENVDRLIKRTHERTGRKMLVVQGYDNPTEIASGISKNMEDIRADYVKRLLSAPEERFLPTILRRSYLRRRYRV